MYSARDGSWTLRCEPKLRLSAGYSPIHIEPYMPYDAVLQYPPQGESTQAFREISSPTEGV